MTETSSPTSVLGVPVLQEAEYRRFQQMIFEAAGIHMSPAKRSLVAGRLAKRVKALGLASYGAYFAVLERDSAERQQAVDLLTTNETYFFREPKHFEFLREQILPARPPGQEFRVWSAACSSGEEPYTAAMVLADVLGSQGWSVLGSDISTRMLARARRGIYPLARAERMPREYLTRYCLKGTGEHEGELLVHASLRQRVEFSQINLNQPLPAMPSFDLILLRNVMIYFNTATKIAVVQRVIQRLKPGGYLFIGHSESLHGINTELVQVAPSMYRRPR